MIPSFENFQSRFVEEALDNINELESTLLELDLSPNDKELLEKVFRIMHSLKGGGGMFGFELLSEFSHHMENIYDKIRSGQLAVSSKLLSLTFQSVDILRDLVNVEVIESPEIKVRYQEMVTTVENVLKEEIQVQKSQTVNEGKLTSPNDIPEVTGMATWYIHFYPGAHVLENGTNLLYLIDELGQMGPLKAVPRLLNIPDLEGVEPERSLVFWDLFLSTDMGKAAIMDVFIFVEDDSKIEIQRLSQSDLFTQPQFIARLDTLCENKLEIELADLSEFMVDEPIEEGLAAPVVFDQLGQTSEGKKVTSSSIRVASDKIDGLMNMVSELVITQERLNVIAAQHQIPELKMVAENIQKLTGSLRDSAFSISLIPVESLVTRFQRLVRDLSCSLDKKIAFTTSGTGTELDKTMIESLTDPLLHIIRNSIDHGIEMPDMRKRKGKPETGSIHMEAGYSGANVIVKITDDGAGIDPAKIRANAIEKGLISKDDVLSDNEVLNLVFAPGFSTSKEVTEVSGRGVGMDVVKRNISAIRGEVSIESVPGEGTTISIILPLVLSIIDGLLVQVNHTQYIIPLALTDRIYSIGSDVLKDGFINSVTLNGIQYPFYNLRKELELNGEVPKRYQMVVVNHTDTRIAIAVDKVVGKIQAVLKPLGRMYHDQKVISAATIMGDGGIALVLDTNSIVKELLNPS
ncbi:chemotaxis protein CheA [Geofilum rubicundum]|uniref:Chemotaxis protein CheA n=1 Tax=Geofilum rubicundum JCM 15548 TaxID=1236989 RepID=A0A0E9LTJ6_9BACT|nr:chemotaxis protein CheA [Geofilum rubicundum]GAO28451.1 signal transduction histidine kinase CheA [Geofilum rubicundum JCM 15548]